MTKGYSFVSDALFCKNFLELRNMVNYFSHNNEFSYKELRVGI